MGRLLRQEVELGKVEHLSPEETEAQIAASHPDIRAIGDYWRKKVGDRRMPPDRALGRRREPYCYRDDYDYTFNPRVESSVLLRYHSRDKDREYKD